MTLLPFNRSACIPLGVWLGLSVCIPVSIADIDHATLRQQERNARWLEKLDQPEYVIPGIKPGESRLLTPGEQADSAIEDSDYDDEDILLEPPELLPEQQPSVRSWLLGVGLVDQHADNFDARRLLSAQARLPLTDYWYLMAGMEYGVLSDDPVKREDGVAVLVSNTTTLALYSGLGAPLLRGIVKTPGGTYAPWQVGVEGLLGEQVTGDQSGRYVGAGINMTLMLQSFWLASDWRWFNVDDEALKAAGIHQGVQLGLSAGVWF